ncbi:MAG: DEAD/DEAH box helicase family protein [Phenylobacterium sp.]|nr:DEAD/DEAH box helicase family protein [Phenylobacterium sp.]
MSKAFFEHPILNSPYEEPTRHHALDSSGQPTSLPPQNGRRKSELISPVPAARNRGRRAREADLFGEQDEADLAYTLTIINEIRSHVASWRQLKNPADWGVTPVTQRLLTYWRKHDFATVRPFFCQVEAVETAIWLTEVAPKQRQYARCWEHIRSANQANNPELIRIALKLATGAGKTTVMAMLIAWQTLNAVRSGDASKFSRAFLIVTPGITIRDRLGVLLPSHPENYYATRELVPADMVADMGRAKVVLTNYHAFKRRETMSLSKTGRGLLEGRDGPIQTIETEGAMLKRACGQLLGFKNVIAINDEAHHCYRERQEDAETPIAAEEKEEAKRNAEAARLWISGLEALKRKIGVRTVFDLSATPFFLRGSGYREGTLFPWTVSDFSLMDAIECGIVKLPRIPVSDNSVTGEAPIYRELWDHIGKRMPKKGAGKSGDLDPLAATFPAELQTALYALYSHYEKTDEAWRRAGIDVPPVFIVVCNNTATSKLVYEWIAGFEREDEDGEMRFRHAGHLNLFRNYDEHGNSLTRFNTLLVDSEALESGEALDASFRGMMGAEIEQFKRELIEKSGDVQRADNLSDSDLLREAMNTVGRKGRLGEQIRCVVSVSMLTEGWDANTVTHIMGVRAFGTQLLCEQVVGRGLRRQSYELNKDGLFDVEYADILGIPFNFAAEPVVAPVKPPAKTTRVQALRERAELEITFPRVEGYRYDLPDERLTAVFTPDSRFELNPGNVGPSIVQNEGIVGEGVELSPQILEDMRPSSISYHLAKRLLFTRFRDPGEDPPMHLFGDLQRICRRWITEGYLEARGVPTGAILYTELADRAAELIFFACQRGVQGEKKVKAIVDAYNPTGSTRFVAFNTSKDVYATGPDRSHVSHVVLDSDWESELARVLERHPRVRAYVKNQGMSFEVPYRDGAVPRKYVPDFIVQLDDGREDALNLILETKGYRGLDAQLKAETMKGLWVPGVNNLGLYGRWAFAEFTEPYGMQDTFDQLVGSLVQVSETV